MEGGRFEAKHPPLTSLAKITVLTQEAACEKLVLIRECRRTGRVQRMGKDGWANMCTMVG